jgi:TatD DNase family protein
MKLARESLEMGFFVSFSGILTFPRAGELHDVARGVPLDRLLIETDSPFLAPVPHRGKRNEPAYVVEVAKTLAKLKGIGLDAVAEATTSNYKRLFSRNLRSVFQEQLH